MSLLACVTRPPLIPFPHSYIKGWLPLLHLYFYTNLKAIQPNKGKSWLFSHSSSSSHTHPPKHTTKPTLNCLFKIYKEEKLASCVTMIQELFGGGASTGLLGERKISLSGVLETRSPSPSISTSSSTTTTPATSSAPQTTSENQNLRCPRCDSANTKFCYYNNYNLTQPRHFCKTCRRYWTKGGALRNVPIGGGCRKNKSTTVVASPVGKAISTSKLKTVVMSSDIGKSGFMSGFDHELPSNPILWGGPSQSSQLLALLRATNQSPNPNPNFSSNPVNTVKDEGFMNIGSSSMATSDASLNGRNFGFDSMGQVPSIGMCSSFWRNNISNQAPHEQQQNGGFVLGEIQNTTGMNSSQLYQRLRSSPLGNYYHSDQTPVILGNVASSSSPSTILESSPVAGGELGFWNPALSWSDLSTVNGAYP